MSLYSGNIWNCKDENECNWAELNECSDLAICVNSGNERSFFSYFPDKILTFLKEGSYTSECNTGSTGDGFVCNDVDECLTQLSTGKGGIMLQKNGSAFEVWS